MYEIRENRRRLKDGTEITTYTRDIYSCNILEVEAGSTGYMGGDTGHGGRTYFRIKDEGCTDMDVRVMRDRFGDTEGYEVMLGGDCGEMFRRIHWNNRGHKSIVWRCISKLEPTGLECHARTINELDLQEIVLTALNELLGDKSKYQKQLQQNITSVIRASATITTDGIDEKLMELQQELVKKANNKEAYDEIADQIFVLREKRQQASMDTVQRDEQLQRITELQDFIKDQSSDLKEFDEALVKRWLKQIVIWPTHYTVELKSELKVDVER